LNANKEFVKTVQVIAKWIVAKTWYVC
jgi:hypothetical protein